MYVDLSVPGGNLVHYYDFMTPPTSPAPPTPPPPPLVPCNELICKDKHLQNIQSFKFSSYSSVLWGTENNKGKICWTSRTDSMSSSTWHSKCNHKSQTMHIAEVKVSSKIWTVGGYTRANWYSSGYQSDSTASLFQLSPNVYKAMAGSGQHGGYNYAIYKSNDYGPTFGAGHDWYTSSNMKTGYANLGHQYK